MFDLRTPYSTFADLVRRIILYSTYVLLITCIIVGSTRFFLVVYILSFLFSFNILDYPTMYVKIALKIVYKTISLMNMSCLV